MKWKKVKPYSLSIIVAVGYLALFIYDPTLGAKSVKTLGSYLFEMLQVMPPVFILTSLMLIWIPRHVIINHFGQQAGWRGWLLSILIGTVSSGPLYAAFPVAVALLNKGSSLANVVIVVSSWAVIKLPMLALESKFLGVRFALLRTALTVPAIIIMALLMEKRFGQGHVEKYLPTADAVSSD